MNKNDLIVNILCKVIIFIMVGYKILIGMFEILMLFIKFGIVCK